MKREPNDTPADRWEIFPRPYRRAMFWATLVWFVSLGLLFVGLSAPRWISGDTASAGDAVTGSWQTGEVLAIAIASLLISYASHLPNLVGHVASRRNDAVAAAERGQRESSQLVAGVLIRLIGTVALFLTCRYQMATPIEMVAAMTIGWYVLLTFVDTLVLSRELPRSAGNQLDLVPFQQLGSRPDGPQRLDGPAPARG